MNNRDLYIKASTSGGTPSTLRTTAKTLKTGQTISYTSRDDGELQEGRGVDFFTLDEENVFGNTNRFTDTLGGQTYSDDVVLDHQTFDGQTILAYCRILTATDTWSNAIDIITGSFRGGFNDWRMVNIKEILGLVCYEGTDALGYSPFTITNQIIMTSTTMPTDTARCITISGISIAVSAKITSRPAMQCRDYTLTDLGL